jgi:hypothetical protein
VNTEESQLETGQKWRVERLMDGRGGWRVIDERDPEAKKRVCLDSDLRGSNGWSLWHVLMNLVERSGTEPGEITIVWRSHHPSVTLYYPGAAAEWPGLVKPPDWQERLAGEQEKGG